MIKIGYAMCGSFCTIAKSIAVMELLREKGYDILPIMSETAYSTDTRFGKSNDINEKIKAICQKDIIHSIKDSEPIGPKAMTDIMIIAPCTGNTLSKMSNAITDTAVTMAAKSHLRQKKPLLIALSTNDALGASAKNFGRMLNVKDVFFVPMTQDDPVEKPNSLVARFDLIEESMRLALEGKQLEPLFVSSF